MSESKFKEKEALNNENIKQAYLFYEEALDKHFDSNEHEAIRLYENALNLLQKENFSLLNNIYEEIYIGLASCYLEIGSFEKQTDSLNKLRDLRRIQPFYKNENYFIEKYFDHQKSLVKLIENLIESFFESDEDLKMGLAAKFNLRAEQKKSSYRINDINRGNELPLNSIIKAAKAIKGCKEFENFLGDNYSNIINSTTKELEKSGELIIGFVIFYSYIFTEEDDLKSFLKDYSSKVKLIIVPYNDLVLNKSKPDEKKILFNIFDITNKDPWGKVEFYFSNNSDIEYRFFFGTWEQEFFSKWRNQYIIRNFNIKQMLNTEKRLPINNGKTDDEIKECIKKRKIQNSFQPINFENLTTLYDEFIRTFPKHTKRDTCLVELLNNLWEKKAYSKQNLIKLNKLISNIVMNELNKSYFAMECSNCHNTYPFTHTRVGDKTKKKVDKRKSYKDKCYICQPQGTSRKGLKTNFIIINNTN